MDNKRGDVNFSSTPELDKLQRDTVKNQSTGNNENYSLDEGRVAFGNLAIFLVMGVLIILGWLGFEWAEYAFIISLYTILGASLVQKKISFSKNTRAPSVGLLIIKGKRAIFLSILFILVLTIILLLTQTNIMDFILVSGSTFEHQLNLSPLLIALLPGIIVGYSYVKLSDYWEQISLRKYNNVISGN